MLIFASFQKVKDMKFLTEVQRYTISVMWQNNFSKVQMASAIGVHKSTVSRELQRNKDEKSGIYDWSKAQGKKQRKAEN